MSNLLERAVWTGVQSGLALVTVEGLFGSGADPVHTIVVAGVASGLSALKTFSQERLATLREGEE